MEAGFIALVAILVIGCIVFLLIKKSKSTDENTQGIIYVYYRDTDSGPALLLEYSVPIDDIASRKRVTFDVDVIR